MKKLILLKFLLIFSFSIFAQVPTDALIAYYPFNGNADDVSGSGFNGQVTGATLVADRRGEPVSAYFFDGLNDGISISNFNINPEAFTISLWFNASNDGDVNTKEILQRSNPTNKSDWCWNVSWYKKNGPSKLYSGIKTTNRAVTDSVDSAVKNRWNHIIITWDGSTKKVYVNGLLKKTNYAPGSMDYTNKNNLYIGFDSETGYFKGSIDDIRIYSRVLTLDEMNQLEVEGETYSIKLLSPAGGEEFIAGANHEIKWVAIGVSSVKIDYSLDSGATWINLVSYYNNSGVYVWTTPELTATNCLVRISNTENSALFDVSSSVFSIEQYRVKILSPDGDEVCGIGKEYPIKWNSNNIQFVNIDYSIDNGATWISIAQNYQSNGLYNWTVPNTPSSQALMKITNADTLTVWDISNNNFIITEVTGVNENNEIPQNFSLFQNYPNPFNPTTTISFNILKEGLVNLSIYNALGEKKAEIVNEVMNAGMHNITFNASNLASGVYFYKISSGSFTETKQMLLMK